MQNSFQLLRLFLLDDQSDTDATRIAEFFNGRYLDYQLDETLKQYHELTAGFGTFHEDTRPITKADVKRLFAKYHKITYLDWANFDKLDWEWVTGSLGIETLWHGKIN